VRQAPDERAGALRLLADMNISPKTVALLREQGWDIVRVPELLPLDAPDEQVLERARADGRVVVTQDLDFSTLLALSGEDRPSVVTLRLATSDPEIVARRLLEVLPEVGGALQEGSAVTVEETSVRIRKLPVE
jgi:predicted nuclease of predicted toxin-antitoxin system